MARGFSRRAQRRAERVTARSQRRAKREARRRVVHIPWMPLAVVAGIVAVVGLIAYLVLQQGRPAGSEFGEAARLEADDDPNLPGEHVNLPEIYDGFYGNRDGPNTGEHVSIDVDYVADGNTNPPAGGPHWGRGACPDDPNDATPFCGPAPWGIYREPWEPETLVHNLEHAGVVVWYNTADQTIIDELEDLVRDQLEGGRLVVVAPYPEMEQETIALTAWSRIDRFAASEYSPERVKEFVKVYDRRFNPENI